MATLEAALTWAFAGHGQVVGVVAEAGVGRSKSRPSGRASAGRRNRGKSRRAQEYLSGWRVSELRGLEWRDVDFAGHVVRVAPGAVEEQDGPHVAATR